VVVRVKRAFSEIMNAPRLRCPPAGHFFLVA